MTGHDAEVPGTRDIRRTSGNNGYLLEPRHGCLAMAGSDADHWLHRYEEERTGRGGHHFKKIESLGKDGRSVYVFARDGMDSGTGACKDPCAASWPAVTTAAVTPSAEGIRATIGTISAAGGSKQITLDGRSIYYYAQDRMGGDILGQEVSDAWYLVGPSDEMLGSAGGYQLLHP